MLKEHSVMGKKMFSQETSKTFIIYNGRKKKVLTVRKDVSLLGHISGIMRRPGTTPTQRNACVLAIYLLERMKK